MPQAPLSFQSQSTELTSNGVVVGVTDRIYLLVGDEVTFAEVLVKGDLSGELKYNGRAIKVVEVNSMIGLLVDQNGARGPVWQDVRCAVLRP